MTPSVLEWTEPTDEVFTFMTDLVRPVGAYLCGRPVRDDGRPVLVGGGKPAFPCDPGVHLELPEEHRLGGGVVYLRYRATR